MPDNLPSDNGSPEGADDLFEDGIGNGASKPAGADLQDGVDQDGVDQDGVDQDGVDEAAPEGMWLTASTWLPAELLEALNRCAPDADGTPAIAAGFYQGRPA